jgi:hypothetical protein
MSRSVLYMSMSVDGYIAGPHDTPDNPGGDGFMRLHDWYGFVSEPEPETELDDPSGIGRSSSTRSDRPVRSCRAATPWSRSTSGMVITTACRSSWSAIGHRARRRSGTRW